jgi:hypothetical protein
MNVWRWLGLFVFFAALTCFVGTRLPVYAGGKDKKEEKDKKDDKKDDKGDKKQEAKAGSGDSKFKAFDPDAKPFYQEVKTETTQTMKVQGQDVTQKQDQTFYILWTPQKKDGDNYKVSQKIVGVKMNIDIGGNKIAYDSTVPDEKQPKNPMTDFFKALMKQELTFHIKPSLEIGKIEGRVEFIKALSDTNPAIKTLLDTIMDEKALQQMAEPTWWAVPTSSGKTWEKTSMLKLGPLGDYQTKFTFTDEGATDGKLEKIKIDAKLDYSQPKDKAGLPFTIKKCELVSKSGTGEALFDAAKGRIESSKLTMKLEGNLTIEVGNMATDITLNQDQTSTTKSFDDDPLKKK